MVHNRSGRTVIGRLVIATILLAAFVFLAGCSGAGTPMAPKEEPKEPDPKPTPSEPMPTLLGTWQLVSVDRDDDGNEVATETTMLTFTATHYIDRTVVSKSGVRFDDWDNAGTYTSTSETTIEKTSYVDHDGDGIAEVISIEKEYLFAGDSLLIHNWGSEHREERYERYERVKDLPTSETSGATAFHGTWQRLGYWDDEDHGPSREDFLLTFTPNRFIESFINGDSATNEIRDTWHWQGGWSTTEPDTITKTFVTDDGNGRGSVDKKYVLAGDLLAVECWTCDDPDHDYTVFTRVQDPLPAGLLGSWQFDWMWDHDTDDERDDLFFTLTAEVAESITLVREARNRSGELDYIRTIEATWEFDPAEWFLDLTIIQATDVEGEGEPEVDDDPGWVPGTRRRIALAPSPMPDHVRVSSLGNEERWDDTQGQWMDHPDNPFGNYWMEWARQ